MLNRRAVLGALGLLPVPLVAAAEEPGKVYRIGFLRSGHPPEGYIAGLQQGLREQGYIPGQNVVLELRATDGSVDQLPALAPWQGIEIPVGCARTHRVVSGMRAAFA